MHEDDGLDNVFGGGSIAGIGVVSGARCMVLASDSGIKGGAAHPTGVEKAIRAQEIALANKLPFVQLVESAGANLMLQAEMFVRGGAIFANLARMSAAGIPVVSIVHGSSTAGGAYQTGLADYVVMVRGRSKVCLAGPPLLKAATGEIADDEELGGAELHCATTGLGEYLAEDDADALRIGREILARLGWTAPTTTRAAAPPLYDAEELLGVVPIDYRKLYDVREVIARVVDGSDFFDFKSAYGAATVCGHAAIEGQPVGLDRFGRFQQGGPVHPVVPSGGHADRVLAEHDRLSCRRRGGDVGHRQTRIKNDPGRHQCGCSQAHAANRRIVRRRPLRHVR
jgi:geranyl-CoA carboxylase beta subunit